MSVIPAEYLKEEVQNTGQCIHTYIALGRSNHLIRQYGRLPMCRDGGGFCLHVVRACACVRACVCVCTCVYLSVKVVITQRR